jgi:hypothetical protein
MAVVTVILSFLMVGVSLAEAGLQLCRTSADQSNGPSTLTVRGSHCCCCTGADDGQCPAGLQRGCVEVEKACAGPLLPKGESPSITLSQFPARVIPLFSPNGEQPETLVVRGATSLLEVKLLR